MARAVGIDISKYQVDFDIDNAKEPVDFIWQRTSYGLKTDEKFDSLWPGVSEFKNRVGPIGAYHYFSTAVPWKEQAQKFLTLIDGRGYGKYSLDYEHYYNNLNKQSAVAAGNWVDFVQQKTGVEVVLYCGIYHLRDHLNPFVTWQNNRNLWISRWPGGTVNVHEDDPDLSLNDEEVRPEGDWKFWQYEVSEEGDRYGVDSRKIDLNVFNGTIDELRDYFGWEQEPQPAPTLEPGPDELRQARIDALQWVVDTARDRITQLEGS